MHYARPFFRREHTTAVCLYCSVCVSLLGWATVTKGGLYKSGANTTGYLEKVELHTYPLYTK